jgi:hypothetical protein
LCEQREKKKTAEKAWGFLFVGGEGAGMAEHKEEHESVMESVMDKISDKFHGDGDSSSSSSDSDDDKKKGSSSAAAAKIYRLFGREKPVHAVLGGGKRKPLPQLSVLVQIRKFWCRSDRSDLVYCFFLFELLLLLR